jgi:hypothetical protein
MWSSCPAPILARSACSAERWEMVMSTMPMALPRGKPDDPA